MKRIVIAAAVVVAGIVGFAGGSPATADDEKPGQEVCGPLDSGKINTSGDPLSVTVSAPAGKVITGYCVKAGSDQSVPGGAVRYVTGLSVTTLTIRHFSGKAVSHYSLSYGEPDEVEPVTPEVPKYTPPTCTEAGIVVAPADTGDYEYTEEDDGDFRVVTVRAIGEAKLTGDVGPWRFLIAKQTGGQCNPEEPTPSLRITALSPVCEADIPYIDYAVALDGLDPAGRTATLTVRDKDGKEVAKFTDQPLSGRIIYPGANAEPKDWPGWKFADGTWEFDPTDARLREGVTVTADVNPSATGSVSYPAATEKCNGPEIVTTAGPLPPAPPAAAPPAPAAVPGPDVAATLPSTGAGSWLMALLATMLVLAGSGFVALGRRTR